ncbi:MAG TPA: hypothetical protein VH369_13075 [Bryobacteraceae bacterium]|jgi:hypothetical protein
MFFRRPRPHIPTFSERVERLKQAGFSAENLPDGRVRIAKNGIAAIIDDKAMEKAGVLVGSEIGVLLNRGYQMFIETPSGKRLPATAEQLKALHEFENDVKEALDLVNLYNTSLGTTSRKHNYDRLVTLSLTEPRLQGSGPKAASDSRSEAV